jgi:ferredoxin
LDETHFYGGVKMNVSVDKVKCISCGLCIQTCPKVFEWGDDNLAQAKINPAPEEEEENVREAAANCPTEAIKIEE